MALIILGKKYEPGFAPYIKIGYITYFVTKGRRYVTLSGARAEARRLRGRGYYARAVSALDTITGKKFYIIFERKRGK